MFTHWHARMVRKWRFKNRATWDLLETRARSELGEAWCEAFLRFNRKEMCWSMRLALQLIETSIVVLEDREWFEEEIEEGA